MPPRVASLTELLNSLDAATYFLVSSSIFLVVTAVLFFGLGMWLGRLLWGRYKRRFRQSEEVIEAFRGEVALLKRRIAEQSTRHSPGMGPSPLQSIAFKAAPLKSAPGTVDELPFEFIAPETDFPPSKAFTIWTEPSWTPPFARPKRPVSAKGTAVWTDLPANAAKFDAFVTASTVTSSTLPLQPLFAPSDIFMVPRSRAFCVWTEPSWAAPPITPAPMPAAQGFALWTQEDFVPGCRGVSFPSLAHSIWTEAGWNQVRVSGPPLRSARAFTLWTDPEWKPLSRIPWSKAFSLWTDAEWSPTTVAPQPLLQSAAWSLWTSLGFEPACRGVLFPSRAYSLWTEESWTPAPIVPTPRFAARPFSIWTEPPPPAPEVAAPAVSKREAPTPQTAVVGVAAAVASVAASSAPEPRKSQGFVARALAAAKQVLGITQPVPSVTAVTPGESAVAIDAARRADAPAKTLAHPKAPMPAPVARPAGQLSSPVVKPVPSALPPEPLGESPLVPARTADPPKVSAKPSPTPPAVAVSLAATAAAVEALRQTGRVPVMTAPVVPSLGSQLPPSKAFTVWAGGPAFEPAKKITQRIALAALIESKITGKIPLPPPAPVALPPTVPPVPSVPANPAASKTPGHSAPQRPLLDLEPLQFPSEPSKA